MTKSTFKETTETFARCPVLFLSDKTLVLSWFGVREVAMEYGHEWPSSSA